MIRLCADSAATLVISNTVFLSINLATIYSILAYSAKV